MKTGKVAYPGKIVHFKVGDMDDDYLGVLDLQPHPFGRGWYRIKDACVLREFETVEDGKTIHHRAVLKLHHPKHGYEGWVDIKVSPLSNLRILPLDKAMSLYEIYHNEMTGKYDANMIITPDQFNSPLPKIN